MPRIRKGRVDSPITLEAQLSLAHSAWSWASAAALLRRPRSTKDDVWDISQLVIIQMVEPVEHERYRRGLHMLCLALNHLDRCLELLAASRLPKDFPHRLCRAFRKAWRPVRDLRDVLEHQEDYIAGRGKQPSLVMREVHGWINIRGVQVPTRPHQEIRDAAGLLAGIRVQGRHYDLTAVLQRAEDLASALGHFVFPLALQPDDSSTTQRNNDAGKHDA